jgi:hypothetical protein
MRVFVMAVAGLMVAAVGQAQQATVSTTQPSHIVVVAAGCPGQLTAQQQANGGSMSVWTIAQNDPNGPNDLNKPGLGVRVGFQGGAAIRSLELRVSYLPPGLRSIPTDAKPVTTDMRESEKTFVLQEKDAMHVEGDLLVGPAATITRVRLMSVTYANGSVWHPSSADACSVVPSKYMLVEAKK